MTLTARFVIFARKTDGSVFECFRWTRDEASGIARAKADAARFGIECSEFWAKAI